MTIARRQLVELTDLEHAPRLLRSFSPAFLEAAFRVTRWYAVAVPPLLRALLDSGARRIVDLGSGSGGPAAQLQELLRRREGLALPLILTDKQPLCEVEAALKRRAARHGLVLEYHAAPVDATAVPAELDGFRTMFQSFHHFPPATARAILQDAVDNSAGIALFEATQRRLWGLFMVLLVPFAVLLFTPFARPLSLLRLLFTYVIPLAPLVVMWDTAVSVLRSYTDAELLAMTASLSGRAYDWRLGRKWKGLLCISWLVGVPRKSADGADAIGELEQ
jgi:hypothetical protein